MSKPVALCAVLVLGAMFMFGSAEAAGGIITTVAGGGAGDGGAATSASLNDPMDVAVDGAGNLYIADTWNCRIREVSGGTIATVAGNGSCGYSGDGGAATSAILDQPSGVAVDGAGSLYVTDTNNCRIRKVSSGMITTVAGSGSCGYCGDGGAAMRAALDHPADIAVDGAGNLFFTDANNCRVRKVSAGTITTVAGNGTCGYGGDGGSATSASLNDPSGVVVDSTGNLYVGDWGNCRVREVSGG
ncbi:MAG: hypothetical protein M1337_03160, partial [Actinobacteria bacterium]|nr:hypothetical protein [Actinomycetota bacterium]